MDKAKKEAIAARLEKIAALGGGRLTPDAVLQDAKSPKSPLHDQFTWDDSEAAKQWRLSQARELIRSVRVDITVDTREVSTVRYVRDPSAAHDEQGYVETASLSNERDLARAALRRELTTVNALLDRAQSLADALGLSEDIVSARESFARLEIRLKAA